MQRTSADIPPFVALYAPVPPAASATNPVGEDAHTMEPRTSACRIFRIACLHARNVPFRLVSRTSRHVATGSSCTSPPRSIPALVNKPQGAPNLSQTTSKAFSTCCSEATSHKRLTADLAPRFRASAAVASAASTFLSSTATLSPRAAQSRATARPIPSAPPVTTIVRTLSEWDDTLLMFSSTCARLRDIQFFCQVVRQAACSAALL